MRALRRPPTVTVRSTCYNHERYVIESLDSVARQPFSDVQWLIVDDASADDSPRLIRGWLDRNLSGLRRRGLRVEFVHHTRNLGFGRTLNEIVELTEGRYLCGLACDDRMLPHRLVASAERLDRTPACATVYSDAFVIDAHGRRRRTPLMRRFGRWRRPPDGDVFGSLLRFNFIPAPSVTVRTDALRAVGGYDESSTCEDYDLWLRLARHYEFARIDAPMVEYRLHDSNVHRTRVGYGQDGRYDAYRKHIDHPAGAAQLVRHVQGMARRGRLGVDTRRDLAQLDLPCIADWPMARERLLRMDRAASIYRGLDEARALARRLAERF
jgi:glycosyltransferase involved in cell wall biosynthesis